MTRHRLTVVTAWALAGSACGAALWAVLTTRTTLGAAEVIGSLTAAYALLAVVVTAPPKDRPAVATSVGCQAVLPGVPLSTTRPVLLPSPRSAIELST